MIWPKIQLPIILPLLMLAACTTTKQPSQAISVTQPKDLDAEKTHSVIAQSAMPGVWLDYVIDRSGPNAGINSSVYIHNDNESFREVRYERTLLSANPGSARSTIRVEGKGKVWIGNTCAFDVFGSTLCGSSVSYSILN